MTIIDDRNDGTPADAQFSGGIHLQMAVLVKALEEIEEMILTGKSANDAARIAHKALSSVRCLKP